jgi:serine/threonine protein kinase
MCFERLVWLCRRCDRVLLKLGLFRSGLPSTRFIMQRHSFTALNSTFVVDSEYQFVKELGQGAYGCVIAARHRKTNEGCAIKKITNINTKVLCLASSHSLCEPLSQRILTKRCLREIRLELPRQTSIYALQRWSDYYTTSGVTRTYVLFYRPSIDTYCYLEITCLYDMDIVFQPNGNFDEVYLYVGPASSI